ncbi:helix-turn-helix domain-containing protein, partial [Patescibacteria group bacterium]|nr:helix-turn-helix domain-containing protein [Patescibacteria group bacterium]
RSPEFRQLSLSAQMLWIYLRAQYNPLNPDCINPATRRDQVYCSYSELKNINGFRSSATISRAFKELIDNDWIEVAERGGLYAGRSAYYFKGPYSKFPQSTKNFNKRFKVAGRYTYPLKNEPTKKNNDRREQV